MGCFSIGSIFTPLFWTLLSDQSMLEGNEGTYFRHVPVSDDGSMVASTGRKLPATTIVELEIKPVSHPERKCKVCRHFDTDSYVRCDGLKRSRLVLAQLSGVSTSKLEYKSCRK